MAAHGRRQVLLRKASFGLDGDDAIHGRLDVMTAKQSSAIVLRAMQIQPTPSEPVPATGAQTTGTKA